MATLTSGAHGRTNQSGTSDRTKATVQDSARFSRIVTFTGNTVITPTEGDAIAASALTAKTLYEIGVRRVSGSGTIHVIY